MSNEYGGGTLRLTLDAGGGHFNAQWPHTIIFWPEKGKGSVHPHAALIFTVHNASGPDYNPLSPLLPRSISIDVTLIVSISFIIQSDL